MENRMMFFLEIGDTATIERWLSTGERDLDEEDEDGYTLLLLAARCGRPAAAALLLDRGAQVESRIPDGWTPLQNAAAYGKYGHCDMIRLLLSRGAALDARGRHGSNAEAIARRLRCRPEATALLADVRLAGGTWDAYLRYPRKRLLALRVLCARGRRPRTRSSGASSRGAPEARRRGRPGARARPKRASSSSSGARAATSTSKEPRHAPLQSEEGLGDRGGGVVGGPGGGVGCVSDLGAARATEATRAPRTGASS